MEMLMKRCRMVIVGVLVLGIVAVSLGAAPVYGQPRGGWRGMMGDGPGRLLPVLLRGVQLTPEQQAQVHDIMAAHRTTFRTLFGQLRTAHEELADKLYGSGDVQAADLTPQLERINQLRGQLLAEGVNIAMEVGKVLTPEQRAKAAQLKDRMRALRGEMRSLLTESE